MELRSPSVPAGPPRRRNGRQQACEPCRKRKVACDHGFPTCSRCVKCDTPGDCLYLRAERQGLSSAVSRPSTSSSAVTAPAPSHPIPGGSEPARPDESPGYLGFTSFSAVYQEARGGLSLPTVSLDAHTSSSTSVQWPNDAPSDSVLSPRKLEKCLAVLEHVPLRNVGEPLFSRHTIISDGWIRLAAKRLLHSVYTTFSKYFDENRDPKTLVELAKIVCHNTSRPLAEDKMLDAEQWLNSFSGNNLRWEGLGILFTYWGQAHLKGGEGHTPSLAGLTSSRNALAAHLRLARLCKDLCDGATGPNGLLVYLYYKTTVMESMISGDASIAVWKAHAETVALASCAGMHAWSRGAPYKPTASSEARRRTFAQLFNLDKAISSFSGRPPLINRRYALVPMPLDLSDEALLGDEETLARAVAGLDPNGWNTEGKVHPATVLRSRAMLALCKDEVMEIALGDSECSLRYDPIEALLNLKLREMKTASDIPPSLVFHREEVPDLDVTGAILFNKILLHLEHLQTIFCIERLLVQRGYDSYGDLLAVSNEMVSATLIFWTHRDRLEVHGDLEWLVMAFAAPAGGILCMELLRSSQPRASEQAISRSGIIQHLSLLVSFLDWVSPSAPNGTICGSCKTVIRHVLDQALNGAPTATVNSASHTLDVDISVNMNDYFNFGLLDTFDWLRPDIPPEH